MRKCEAWQGVIQKYSLFRGSCSLMISWLLMSSMRNLMVHARPLFTLYYAVLHILIIFCFLMFFSIELGNLPYISVCYMQGGPCTCMHLE